MTQPNDENQPAPGSGPRPDLTKPAAEPDAPAQPTEPAQQAVTPPAFTQAAFTEETFAAQPQPPEQVNPYAPAPSNIPQPGAPLPGSAYPGSAYPGTALPGSAYPGAPYPTAGGPATSYPGYTQHPVAPGPQGPARRPGAVLAAAVVLIVGGVALAILTGALLASGVSIDSYTGGELEPDVRDTAQTVMSVFLVVQVLLCLAAAGTGVWLLTSRSNAARICATVAAALLIVTCYGIVVSIAVPILLFAPEASKAWFRQDEPTPPPPAPY